MESLGQLCSIDVQVHRICMYDTALFVHDLLQVHASLHLLHSEYIGSSEWGRTKREEENQTGAHLEEGVYLTLGLFLRPHE